MKRFLRELLAFLSVLVVLNIGLSIMLKREKYYGNQTFKAKLDSVTHSHQSRDTYFFGSSRIATGIDPIIFDSLMNVNSYSTHSYNMASYGTWYSETHYLIRNFIAESDLHNATILLELEDVMSIDWDKIDTDRNIYYQNWNNFRFIWRTVRARNASSLKGKLVGGHYLASYSLSEFLYTMNLGKSECLVPKGDKVYFDRNGFLERSGRDTTWHLPLKYIASVRKSFGSGNPPNAAVIASINELINFCSVRNIHLLYLLAPKNYTKELASVFEAIPSNHKLDSEFIYNDALYASALWSDESHLSAEGADRYTKIICAAYIKKFDAAKALRHH